MTQQHADILEQQDPIGRPMVFAIALHLSILAALVAYKWLDSQRNSFGAKDAGGAAVGIQAVDAIPLQHAGLPNPVAHDTESQVLQQIAKPVEQAKKEVVSKDAIPLKTREKKRLADVASERQRFRSFKEIDQNRVYATQAPQVSNPLFSAMSGSGRIGIGANTTLGTRFGGYMQQVQMLIGQKWRSGDVTGDSGPVAIVIFDLMRDGTAKNPRLLQRSGNQSLDYSALRAIQDASPFPPIPAGFDKDSASLEVSFELKR